MLPFRLTNIFVTFQLYIHKAFRGLVNCTCIIYLDDILIYLKDKNQHKQHICKVLEQLNKWGLYTKVSKCTFYTKQVEFLGYIVTPISVIMDPVWVQTIQKWLELKSYHNVQMFLNFVNFYRHFIYNYSDVAWHLFNHIMEVSQNLTQRAKNLKAAKKKPKKGPIKWYKS